MKVLSLDLSFAKTGWAVTNIKNDQCILIDSGLIVSDKSLDDIDRIIDTINQIEKIYKKYNPDLTLKEKSLIGRSSTATNVIKTHAVFEYIFYSNLRPYEDVHNGTIKKWARKYMELDKVTDKKIMVANAVEKYYNKRIDTIWGTRGRLIDDVSDAIAITITYLNKLKG